MLKSDNWHTGFLVSDAFLGGVSALEEGGYLSYIVNHETGSTETFQEFPTIDEAIAFLNGWNGTAWAFENIKQCGGGKCSGGGCKDGGCSNQSSDATESKTQSCC